MIPETDFLLQVRCIQCKVLHTIQLNKMAYRDYSLGNGYVQDLFPNLSAGVREMLISRTCEECFDSMFKEV